MKRARATVDGLSNNFDIMDRRQKNLVRYMHDLVNTLTAMGNINLQKEIRNLTGVSLVIALIALLIAMIAFFLK